MYCLVATFLIQIFVPKYIDFNECLKPLFSVAKSTVFIKFLVVSD